MISKPYLENTYGIHIARTCYYSVRKGRVVNEYTVYTADGCKWDNFSTIKDIAEECRKYKETFLNLKAKAGK
jgi:hypothetical protein